MSIKDHWMWVLVVIVLGRCYSIRMMLTYMSTVPSKKKCNKQSKVFRVNLQLLFDPVLHQKAHVGVCYWKTVTHIDLLFGLLCCKTEKDVSLLVLMIHKMMCYSTAIPFTYQTLVMEVPLTKHESSLKVKPKHLDCPQVAGCSTVHELCLPPWKQIENIKSSNLAAELASLILGGS